MTATSLLYNNAPIVKPLNDTPERSTISSHVLSETAIGTAISELIVRYEGMLAANDFANTAKWEALGHIYESAPLVDQPGEDRDNLIKYVTERWDIKNGRWEAHSKSGHELFLTALLGNEHQRSTKSQWLKSLERGKEEGIERSRAAFVEFMKTKGGIGGSMKAKKPLEVIKEWADTSPEVFGEPIEIPVPIGPNECGGFVVTISRVERGRAGEDDFVAYPIASTADPISVAAFIAGLERQNKIQENEIADDHNNEKKKQVSAINGKIKSRHRKQWRAYKKLGKATFSEIQFAREREGLNPYSKDMSDEYIKKNSG